MSSRGSLEASKTASTPSREEYEAAKLATKGAGLGTQCVVKVEQRNVDGEPCPKQDAEKVESMADQPLILIERVYDLSRTEICLPKVEERS